MIVLVVLLNAPPPYSSYPYGRSPSILDVRPISAARYGRFAGRWPSRREADRWTLELARSVCSFVQHDALPRAVPFPAAPVAAPWIAVYTLGSADPALTRDHFAARGLEGQRVTYGETAYRLPTELGGVATGVRAGDAVRSDRTSVGKEGGK